MPAILRLMSVMVRLNVGKMALLFIGLEVAGGQIVRYSIMVPNAEHTGATQ